MSRGRWPRSSCGDICREENQSNQLPKWKDKKIGEDKRNLKVHTFRGVILAHWKPRIPAALCFCCTHYAVRHLDVNAVGWPRTPTSFELR